MFCRRASSRSFFIRFGVMDAMEGLYQDCCRASSYVRWPGNFLALPCGKMPMRIDGGTASGKLTAELGTQSSQTRARLEVSRTGNLRYRRSELCCTLPLAQDSSSHVCTSTWRHSGTGLHTSEAHVQLHARVLRRMGDQGTASEGLLPQCCRIVGSALARCAVQARVERRLRNPTDDLALLLFNDQTQSTALVTQH